MEIITIVAVFLIVSSVIMLTYVSVDNHHALKKWNKNH